MKILTLAALAVVFLASQPVSAACVLAHCKDKTPSRAITNEHRQIIGDLYDPGTGRIQIRDKHRRILGYIEKSGQITNTHRQKIGTVEGLAD